MSTVPLPPPNNTKSNLTSLTTQQSNNNLIIPTTPSPLDDPQFDPLSHLNFLFPTSQSLTQLDVLVHALSRRVASLDVQIQANLRHQLASSFNTSSSPPQNSQSSSSADELSLVTKAMQDLVGSVIQIKEKSRHAESLVLDLTHDIKSLDYAKRNLTTSMSTLRRLSMLSVAVSQLKPHVSRNEYRPIVPLLLSYHHPNRLFRYAQAIRQLQSHFRAFRNINKVADLLNSLHDVQADLRKHIHALFDVSFTPQAQLLPTADPATLNDACLVLDGLEPSGRDGLLQWYTSLVLKEYRSLFNGKDELTSLENVPRRYAWLNRFLKVYDEEHCRVFPGSWRVDHEVCIQFTQETKSGISEAAQCSTTVKTDLKPLIKLMKTTVDFEQVLMSRWTAVTQTDHPPAYREISASLEPLLGGLIDVDEKRIGELMLTFATQGILADEGNPSVLASATELFVQYKGILANITKISRGKLLADMTREVFVKYLDKYAEILLAMATAHGQPVSSISSSAAAWGTPAIMGSFVASTTTKPLGSILGAFSSSSSSATSITPSSPTIAVPPSLKTNFSPGSSSGTPSTVRLSGQAWHELSLILNTAQYCSTIIGQLSEKLKQKTCPAYHSQVSLDQQLDGFKSTAISVIKHMVQVLMDVACEAGWAAMSKVTWGSITKSGDVSSYVTTINSAVQNCVVAVSESVSDSMMVRTFCDKVAEAFPIKFLQVMTKAKPFGEIGAEQALLDLYGLKSYVQTIPTVVDPDAQVSAVYIKIMNKGFSRLETLCKVLMAPGTPIDGFVASFMTVCPERDQTKDTFLLVLELKGFKRQESNQALDLFANLVNGGAADGKGSPPPPAASLWRTGLPEATRSTATTGSASTAASQMKRMFAFGTSNTAPPT